MAKFIVIFEKIYPKIILKEIIGWRKNVLKFWQKRIDKSAELSALFYRRLVQQVRNEWFYRDLAIADSPFGRFEVMTIHLFLILKRLKQENTSLAGKIAQEITNLFVIDLDESLRDLRLSETKIAKQFNKFIQGFYGRLIAYDVAFDESDQALKDVVHRNLYAQLAEKEIHIQKIVSYIHQQLDFLQQQDSTLLKFGDI
jgi:cytochrome b pre-mRNA-processing protein 3